MKRIILVLLLVLTCAGCHKPAVEETLVEEDNTESVIYFKGINTYENRFPDGTVYFISRSVDDFTTGIIDSNGHVLDVATFNRTYPEVLYNMWHGSTEPGVGDLGQYYSSKYQSMIDCFDNDAETCDIHPAQ